MAGTYEPIATSTLSSQSTSVTFSSIPSTYTDLVLVCLGTIVTNGNSLVVEVNGDTNQLGSYTMIYGNGSGTNASNRTNNRSFVNGGWNVAYSDTEISTSILQVFNYANTTTYKTFLTKNSNPNGSTYKGIETSVSLWRSTSAITSLKVFTGGGGDLKAGLTATLYGIKALQGDTMANTHIPIATTTVGSGGANGIEFTSIPGTYTDLKLVFSCRVGSSYGGVFYQTDVTLNSTSSGGTADKLLFGYGSTVGDNSAGATIVYGVTNSAATANTFGNGEIYIPNYTSSSKKIVITDSVSESNDAGAIKSFSAGLFNVTSAVTSVKIASYNGQNFDQYSSATLYGIKKD